MTIEDLQQQLIKRKLDAYIVTRNNMFLGQDVLDEENKVLELCGFSGSAGTLFVLQHKAFLLVDGRYEIQAQKEVNQEKITVVCTSDSLGTWLQKNFSYPLTIAYDPWCHSISEVEFWHRNLKQHHFIEDTQNTLGSRLSCVEPEIFEHDIEYTGISVDEKISYLTNFMQENKLDAFFISDCDAVSWLLNLRSRTLKHTPVLRAFALIDKDVEVSLFTSDFNKIETELAKYKGKEIGISPNSCPRRINRLMKDNNIWMHNLQNPIQKWKAVKNPVELSGFKNAHLKDGIALCNFLYWLENNWKDQNELSLVKKLFEFRSQQPNFKSNSFATIAAVDANGAIVHYSPSAETNANLKNGSLLLLDSGGQYLDGTTDVTRTVAIGNVGNQEIIDSYTQVLKAHIAAASAYFPSGISGHIIDSLARAELWKYGKEYKHGTGHGIGHFLNVHEGPFSLSFHRNQSPLEAGQITSIEPGYYVENQYGIRIENLNYITPVNDDKFPSAMLKFTPLTLVPIDKNLINTYLLNTQEIDWLNTYHQLVYSKLAEHLQSETKKWLAQACAPIQKE